MLFHDRPPLSPKDFWATAVLCERQTSACVKCTTMRSVSCEGHDVVFAPAAGDHAGSHRLRIEEVWMGIDRFGNPFAPNLSYARGEILPSTAHDFKKLQHAWAMIRERGPESIFIFTGLEHSMPMQAEDLRFADDEIGPALHF